MVIAVPKEIVKGENRVSVTPDTASKLIKAGFGVHVESNAGLNSGFINDEYTEAGAKVESDVVSLYNTADIILKVQKPVEIPGQS